MKIKSLLFGAALVVATSAASYGQLIISQTQNITGQTLNFTNLNTSSFNKFNTALGTLQQVRLIYTLTIVSGSIVVDNDGLDAALVDYESNFGGNLRAPSNNAVTFSTMLIGDSLAGNVNLAANVGDTAGVIDGTGPDGTFISLAGLTGTEETILTSGTSFNSFQSASPSTFTLRYSGNRDITVTAEGAEGGFTTASVNGSITVEYTYIPEPSTAALTGLAAAGLLIRRRRR